MHEIEINTEILDFNGQPVAMIGKAGMTIRDAAMQQIGSYRTNDGKKALEAYALGMRVAGHKGSDALLLEKAELTLMKEIIFSNPAGLPIVANVPVLHALNSSKELAVENKRSGS